MCNICLTALNKPVKPEQVIINTMGTLAKELHMRVAKEVWKCYMRYRCVTYFDMIIDYQWWPMAY